MKRPITYACNTGPAGVACDACAAVGPVDLVNKRLIGRVLLCRGCARKSVCDCCRRLFNRLTLEVGGHRRLCSGCDRNGAPRRGVAA